ncbi:unnamed protein product [Pseudo-nitzschia multistriata]|uniref:Uncharacterized protein n=1 Tax=Pseudo-nitzschia multistriata TaxID=183589 RepID=A0A448Z967_9STRA|nr:unnamed protein product [Pseudo-nitzschia multistriata]
MVLLFSVPFRFVSFRCPATDHTAAAKRTPQRRPRQQGSPCATINSTVRSYSHQRRRWAAPHKAFPPRAVPRCGFRSFRHPLGLRARAQGIASHQSRSPGVWIPSVPIVLAPEGSGSGPSAGAVHKRSSTGFRMAWHGMAWHGIVRNGREGNGRDATRCDAMRCMPFARRWHNVLKQPQVQLPERNPPYNTTRGPPNPPWGPPRETPTDRRTERSRRSRRWKHTHVSVPHRRAMSSSSSLRERKRPVRRLHIIVGSSQAGLPTRSIRHHFGDPSVTVEDWLRRFARLHRHVFEECFHGGAFQPLEVVPVRIFVAGRGFFAGERPKPVPPLLPFHPDARLWDCIAGVGYFRRYAGYIYLRILARRPRVDRGVRGTAVAVAQPPAAAATNRRGKSSSSSSISNNNNNNHYYHYPPFRSFCIPPSHKDDNNTRLRKETLRFARKILEDYPKFVTPIVPFQNPARHCHQSPQAMRIFFGKEYPKHCRNQSKHKHKHARGPPKKEVLRSIYGPLSVLRTTGFHPMRDFKVRPFTPEIAAICRLLEQELSRHPRFSKQEEAREFDFNFLEIKLYKGRDIFTDPLTKRPFRDDHNQPIRVDCNKSVGLHNDCSFDDDGNQDPRDTARGDHPIATITIGSPRELTFVQMEKRKSPARNGSTARGRWTVCHPARRRFWLDHGSVFCLMPGDEVPTLSRAKVPCGDRGRTLYKTMHKAEFKADGVSIGLVFRSVRTSSCFCQRSHRWLWRRDPRYRTKVEEHLASKKGVYETYARQQAQPPAPSALAPGGRQAPPRREVDLIHGNIDRYLQTLS